MAKTTKVIFFVAITILGLLATTGCGAKRAKPNKCYNGAVMAGYFCYQGENFGRNLSNDYKEGVVDGCTTANGTFKKNYELSRRSKLYNDGWISGRSRCRLDIKNTADPIVNTHTNQITQATVPSRNQATKSIRNRLKRRNPKMPIIQ